MKSDHLDPTPSSQRRRWLGAISAAAAAVWAWRARAPRATFSTGNSMESSITSGQPSAGATRAASPVRLVIKPSPDSVKRHG